MIDPFVFSSFETVLFKVLNMMEKGYLIDRVPYHEWDLLMASEKDSLVFYPFPSSGDFLMCIVFRCLPGLGPEKKVR